jgi:hypothetical protein
MGVQVRKKEDQSRNKDLKTPKINEKKLFFENKMTKL